MSGYSGAEIYRRMNAVPTTTESLDTAQVTAHRLMVQHERIADRIGRIQDKMHGCWEGAAAERANTGMLPVPNASRQAAEDLGRAKDSMYAQNAVFHEVRGRLEPIEDEMPPIMFGQLPWETSARQTALEWVGKNMHNIAQYDTYATGSAANGGNLVREYPVLAPVVSGTAVGPEPAGGADGTDGDAPLVRPGSDDGTKPSTVAPGRVPSWTPPPVPGIADPPPNPQHPPAATWTPPERTGPSQVVSPSQDGDGYRTPSAGSRPSAHQQGTTGFGPLGTSGGGPVPRGPVGYVGVRGTGGYGGAPGRGAGAVPGAPGTSGSTGTPGQAAGRSTTGGRAVSGVPVGTAGRGRGGEDEEHQRKTKLSAGDPDDVFGLPEGTNTIPPTIGEQKSS